MNGNLDARGVQQRYALGIFGLIGGLLAAALYLSGNLPPSWAKLLFIPFTLAALGYFQAREKTCVCLAAQGLQVNERGQVGPVDAADKRALRERGLKIAVSATGVALVATALLLLLTPR